MSTTRHPITRFSLTYEMSMGIFRIKRSVYTFFNLLGEVGGLGGILFSFAAFIHGMFKYNDAENFVVERLFKEAVDTDLPDSSGQNSLKEHLIDCLPSCF